MSKNVLTFLGSILFSLVLFEIALRIYGIAPLERDAKTESSSASIEGFTLLPWVKPDNEIGFLNNPGSHPFTFYGKRSVVGINPDGSRRVRENATTPENDSPTILFLGDSYTAGAGLEDFETFAWKVQEALPKYQVSNYAVGGHSTCQTLLLVKDLTASKKLQNGIVILGLNDFLATRNYPDPKDDLSIAQRSPFNSSLYPRCYLTDEKRIDVKEPFIWGKTNPLAHWSSLALFLELSKRKFEAPFDTESQRAIAFGIIQEIRSVLFSQNAQLIIFMQQFEESEKVLYEAFFKQEQIPFIPAERHIFQPGMTFPDGHPNEKLNALWAKRVLRYLEQQLNSG